MTINIGKELHRYQASVNTQQKSLEDMEFPKNCLDLSIELKSPFFAARTKKNINNTRLLILVLRASLYLL